MFNQTMYDIVVVGAGPGGYVAAIRASQLGMKTALIEKNALGGVCLNKGCIPTKALLRTAEIKHLIDRSQEFGINVGSISIDFEKIMGRAQNVKDTLQKGIGHLLKKNKVDVIYGFGKLVGPHKVQVESDIVKGKYIILATGARPRTLTGVVPHERIWTSKEALTPSFFPKTLVIIGSGAIGIEFASFYQTLGSKVVVIEMMDRILPVEDVDISKAALSSFQKQGMVFHLSSKVESVNAFDDRVVVQVNQQAITADAVLVAIGVVANTENLGLEDLGINVGNGSIICNEWNQTSCPSIFAIGDVSGPPWLAHKATHEGILCVEHIAGLPDLHPLDKTTIPGCTYSLPQIASVGKTESALKDTPIRSGKFFFKGNGKALAIGENEGFIKTIFHEKTGELLGAHMIGEGVTEMIQGFVVAKSLEATQESLAHIIFPHPTLSEAMHESVLDSLGACLHA